MTSLNKTPLTIEKTHPYMGFHTVRSIQSSPTKHLPLGTRRQLEDQVVGTLCQQHGQNPCLAILKHCNTSSSDAESPTETNGAWESSTRRLCSAIPLRSKGLHTGGNAQSKRKPAKGKRTSGVNKLQHPECERLNWKVFVGR